MHPIPFLGYTAEKLAGGHFRKIPNLQRTSSKLSNGRNLAHSIFMLCANVLAGRSSKLQKKFCAFALEVDSRFVLVGVSFPAFAPSFFFFFQST
jgi:hypothetical protein